MAVAWGKRSVGQCNGDCSPNPTLQQNIRKQRMVRTTGFQIVFPFPLLIYLNLNPHILFYWKTQMHKDFILLILWLFSVCFLCLTFFFCFYWVSTPTDFWVISHTCSHTKCFHFIWNLTWGKSCSSTFCFLAVNNNAGISYLLSFCFSLFTLRSIWSARLLVFLLKLALDL